MIQYMRPCLGLGLGLFYWSVAYRLYRHHLLTYNVQLAVGEQEKLGAAIGGMERVAVLIGRCAIYEQLYLIHNVPKNAADATENLRRVLLTLYIAILQALCRLIRVFQGRIPVIYWASSPKGA